MNGTIREQLIDHLMTRMRTLSGVGLVADAASLDVNEISAQLASSKAVLEVATTDDEWMDTAPTGMEQFSFMLVVTAYFPKPVPPATGSSVAAGMHGDLYVLLAGSAAVWTQNNLAFKTEPRGGGAAAIDPQLGCVQGFSLFEIQYRHAVGNPTAL